MYNCAETFVAHLGGNTVCHLKTTRYYVRQCQLLSVVTQDTNHNTSSTRYLTRNNQPLRSCSAEYVGCRTKQEAE
jgi:hypothetical protein